MINRCLGASDLVPSIGVLRPSARRSFPPVPPLPISGSFIWLYGSSVNPGNGKPVTVWTDESGNGNNATAAGAARPTFILNALNGWPVLRFDGTNNYMDIAATLTIPYTIMAVAKPAAWNLSTLNILFAYQNIVYAIYYDGPNTVVRSFNNGFIGAGDLATGDFHYFANVCDANQSRLEIDANIHGGDQTGGSDMTTVRIGWTNQAGDAKWNGDIAEVVAWNRVLDDSELLTMQSYFQTKYGLS